MADLPKLDLKDKKILIELDRNARQTNSEIAKKVGLNKNTVNYKISRFIERGIVSGYWTVIDNSKLGYFIIRVYLKFFNSNKNNEKKMKDFLVAHKMIGVVAEIDAPYDLVFMFFAKTIYDWEDFWSDFKKKFRKYFWEEKVHIFSKVYYYEREYLHEKINNASRIFQTIGGRDNINYDELDLKILKLLDKNARIPLIDIADKLKTPERTIAFRIKGLEKKKIIQGYRAKISLDKLGYEYYKLNFIMNDNSNYDELFSFCQNHKNVIYIDQTVDELDFEIDVEVKGRQELLNLINEIKEKFNVRQVEILNFRNYIKLESLPAN